MATLILFLTYCVILTASSNATDMKVLETKLKDIKQSLTVLTADVNSMKNVLSSSTQFCHLQPANICGPCTCIDDARTTNKYYCDCRNLGAKRDCAEFSHQGIKTNGIYLVSQLNLKTIQVFCDQESDGGGWTVIQRRMDGTENFHRDWDAYKRGFGNFNHEFWIGNENIHTLELQSKFGKGTEIRIEMMKRSGDSYYAKYDWFQVGNERTNYRLHISGYSGNAGDSFSQHNGMMFTTVDRDNDKLTDNNCAQKRGGGGWWYSSCGNSLLNGIYYHYGEAVPSLQGILWWSSMYSTDSLKRTEIKIRRKL